MPLKESQQMKKQGIRQTRRERKAIIKEVFGRKKKNHYNGESIAPILGSNPGRRCFFCGKIKQEYELTLTDDLIARDICEDCLKFREQLKVDKVARL